MKKVRVKVFWVSSAAGGRRSRFTGQRYSTPALFPETADIWPYEAWSVVLEFEKDPSISGNPSYATASFLADQAPKELLFRGQVFEMFEGPKLTAIVEVL